MGHSQPKSNRFEGGALLPVFPVAMAAGHSPPSAAFKEAVRVQSPWRFQILKNRDLADTVIG